MKLGPLIRLNFPNWIENKKDLVEAWIMTVYLLRFVYMIFPFVVQMSCGLMFAGTYLAKLSGHGLLTSLN